MACSTVRGLINQTSNNNKCNECSVLELKSEKETKKVKKKAKRKVVDKKKRTEIES